MSENKTSRRIDIFLTSIVVIFIVFTIAIVFVIAENAMLFTEVNNIKETLPRIACTHDDYNILNTETVETVETEEPAIESEEKVGELTGYMEDGAFSIVHFTSIAVTNDADAIVFYTDLNNKIAINSVNSTAEIFLTEEGYSYTLSNVRLLIR